VFFHIKVEKPKGRMMATTRTAIAPMKAAQVPKPGADFEIVERETPKPAAGQVRVKLQACGVCHSDSVTVEGSWPGIQYPRVPGHEVVGIVDELGEAVSEWKKGQRVGVGWHGGHDGTCRECRRGDFGNCRNLKIPGISYDGTNAAEALQKLGGARVILATAPSSKAGSVLICRSD
jgi:D-arabinose 1-dehydrogenase-like Zn-dependent alcohol dehydrogenase